MSGSPRRLKLSRMELEEAGPDPQLQAEAILAELGPIMCALPIAQIATELDIVEIRRARLTGLEAALVMGPERDKGAIAVKEDSPPSRQRFSIAHELGHFLNLRHRPLNPDGGFVCRPDDFKTPWRNVSADAERHFRQESEANRFAIELLAPRSVFRPLLKGIPGLDTVLSLAALLELSKEACARRYCELHPEPSALVFSRNGVVRYIDRNREFPAVSCRRNDPLPSVPSSAQGDSLSPHEEVDARDWLFRQGRRDLIAQTLHQTDGFAITLLAFDLSEPEDDEGE